ncbi:DUF3341 domain-containing protein, partial [Mesorhizobium sp. M7A.F.Ca.US.001.01.1.1]
MSLYGVIATFADADALTAAAHDMRDRGYSRMDAFSPYAVKGLAE